MTSKQFALCQYLKYLGFGISGISLLCTSKTIIVEVFICTYVQ